LALGKYEFSLPLERGLSHPALQMFALVALAAAVAMAEVAVASQ
jgi:hypothetical protein